MLLYDNVAILTAVLLTCGQYVLGSLFKDTEAKCQTYFASRIKCQLLNVEIQVILLVFHVHLEASIKW